MPSVTRILNFGVIDGPARPRYSLAQIKDLVAYAIPQSQGAVQSLGSPLRRVSETPLKSAALPHSLHRPVSCTSSATKIDRDAPGGSACGSARSISRIQRHIGGHRTL